MSVGLLQLWMPILLGAVLAWIASGLIHTVLKYHNADYQKLSNEDEVSAALRKGSPGLGVHTLPHCVDMSDMKTEAMQQKFAAGPVAMVTIFPNGMPNMGKLMAQQVSYFVVGCLLIAYCATLALAPGASGLSVFRVVTATGFLAFGWSNVPFSIWYGHPWSTTARYLFDAMIYALIAGGTFAWLWP